MKRHNRRRPPIAYKVKKECVVFARKKLKENPQITIEELILNHSERYTDYRKKITIILFV